MRKFVMGAAFALLLAGTAQAESTWLKPDSKYGVIVVEIEPGGAGAVDNGGYDLNLAAFSPSEHAFAITQLTGWVEFRKLSRRPEPRTYHLKKVKPGHYAFLGMSVKSWGVCYNGDSQTFEVKPGQVSFVGRYDPRPSIYDVTRAVTIGQLPRAANSGEQHYVFDSARLPLTPAADIADWRPGLEAWLKEKYPEVVAPVEAVETTPTYFSTGTGIFGKGRFCGGYYAKKEKAAPAAKAVEAEGARP